MISQWGSQWMDLALAEARKAGALGEVPVGAVLVWDGKAIAAAGNRVEELSDPTAHAEMLVIREAARLLRTPRLMGGGFICYPRTMPHVRNGLVLCPPEAGFLWRV